MRSAAALAVLVPALAGCTGKYVRPTTREPVAATPARLERGAYLVNQLCACGACHSTRESGDLLDGESSTMFLGGGNVFEQDVPSLVKLYVPNLTSDPATGLGLWSDDQIRRAVRDGVDAHGGLLFPVMPFDAFQHMSDDDVDAVVAYLRSVPAVKQPRPPFPRVLPFMAKLFVLDFGLAFHRPAMNVRAPPREDRLAYGKYVAELGACTDCHSMSARGPWREGDSRFMSGSAEPFAWPRLGKVWARNLTPDATTGLGRYAAKQIADALRNGRRLDGKRMAPPMALVIPHVSGLTDDDLDALVTWLRSLPPVSRAVPERQLTPEMAAIYDAP